MARTIYLPNGSAPVLFSAEDFYRLVEEWMGPEAGRVVRTLADRAGVDAEEETILEKEIN